MNFSESILFSDISHNEHENEMSENIIYIGAAIGFIFGAIILFIKYICKPKKEINAILEISI
jgi:hypothetical protein